MLDAWWSELPPAAAAQVRDRFTDHNDIVHRGAFLELYLHTLGRVMGFDVDIDVGNDADGQRRPDLLLGRSGVGEFFIEATALTGDDVGDPVINSRVDEIHDAINAVTAPGFCVDLDITEHGTGTPSAKTITKAVQRFLAGLDPDQELAAIAAGKPPRQTEVKTGGWTLSLVADPLEPEHRDYPHHRVLNGPLGDGDFIDNITPIRRKLKDKAGHYGHLGKPYVVALLCASTFADDHDMERALMGPIEYWHDGNELRPGRRPNGVWLGPSGPINTRLSGVLTFPQLSPTAICAVQPTLWINPDATHPLTDIGPWRQMEVFSTRRPVEHPATATVAEILGLPERWPFEAVTAAA
jgi:hypothetical protein